MTETQFSETDRAFYTDGYKLGIEVVDNGMTKDALFASIRTMYTTIDDLIKVLLGHAEHQGVNIACEKGCSWCCNQPIYALSHEIHYLAGYLSRNFSISQIQGILEKAEKKNEAVAKLSDEEILCYKSPCPLLKEGACSAYEARPMACRIYLSQKVSTCEEFYNHPGNKHNFPDLLDFPLRAGRMMNEGFIAALKTENLHGVEYRIEQGIEVGLSTIASDIKLLKDTPLYY